MGAMSAPSPNPGLMADSISKIGTAVQMLQTGQIARNWLGFTWIPYEAMDVPAASTYRTAAYCKSAIHFGTGINVKTWVGENTNKRGHPVESYVWMSLGAGRQDELKVVQIDFTNA